MRRRRGLCTGREKGVHKGVGMGGAWRGEECEGRLGALPACRRTHLYLGYGHVVVAGGKKCREEHAPQPWVHKVVEREVAEELEDVWALAPLEYRLVAGIADHGEANKQERLVEKLCHLL